MGLNWQVWFESVARLVDGSELVFLGFQRLLNRWVRLLLGFV